MASERTRLLNSSQESSRLMKRAGRSSKVQPSPLSCFLPDLPDIPSVPLVSGTIRRAGVKKYARDKYPLSFMNHTQGNRLLSVLTGYQIHEIVPYLPAHTKITDKTAGIRQDFLILTGTGQALSGGFLRKDELSTTIPNNFSIHRTIYLLP
jgi:hypothetical protein